MRQNARQRRGRGRAQAAPSTAFVISFPLAARQDLVRRIVEQMLDRSGPDAEKHLQQHLACQERTLYRKQLSPKAVAHEIKHLEAAVRAGLWRCVLGGDL